MHNSQHHVPFAQDVAHIQMVGMGTSMNDTIHIKVQMVKLGQQCRIRNDLIDLGIAFTDPSVKLMDDYPK
eukprot:scaffold7008_cov40-Attheya_sp.AAC.3